MNQSGRTEVPQNWPNIGLFCHRLHCTLLQHCTLHTVHFKLQTALCTQSTAHKTLYTKHCTLHYEHYIVHTAHCTLNTAHCPLHTTHCTQHNEHCTMHCTQYTAHCTVCLTLIGDQMLLWQDGHTTLLTFHSLHFTTLLTLHFSANCSLFTVQKWSSTVQGSIVGILE